MANMIFTEATIGDILELQEVWNRVNENTLGNPALVRNDDAKEYITERGTGWAG